MNVGFFGIQYSFGLQQSAVNPIYDMLGASPDEIPLLNLAGPMTGLLVQPIIGALSDKTYSPKWGRRKPYFFIGAILCSLCLFLFPFSSSLWMAAGLLWILDVGNNTAMEPYRAFVSDKLNDDQKGLGFQAQSFFTGFGQTLANISLFIFPAIIAGKNGHIPNWVFASFFLGAACSILSIWWSMRTTPEHPLSQEEIDEIKASPIRLTTPITDVMLAIKSMPKIMWGLALVYLFQWYALFCYWQNSSKSVALNSFDWKIPSENEGKLKKKFLLFEKTLKKDLENKNAKFESIKKTDSTYALLAQNWQNKIASQKFTSDEIKTLKAIEQNDTNYEKAASYTGLVNGWYNVVTFLVAFVLVGLAKKYSPKYVHFMCLLVAGIGFLAFSVVENKLLLYPAITGFGIGWASMMGIPYLMVVNDIPREKVGVYMGIINMMIVIPMLIQTVTFGYILKHFLNNDPRNAILFAGILLIISSLFTLRLQSQKA
ncbi:MAG: MFS transporter [Leadbetterella sp.]